MHGIIIDMIPSLEKIIATIFVQRKIKHSPFDCETTRTRTTHPKYKLLLIYLCMHTFH